MKITPIIAIITVAILTAYAIHQHIDGALLSTSFVILGGLGGYSAKKLRR